MRQNSSTFNRGRQAQKKLGALSGSGNLRRKETFDPGLCKVNKAPDQLRRSPADKQGL